MLTTLQNAREITEQELCETKRSALEILIDVSSQYRQQFSELFLAGNLSSQRN